MNIILIGFKHAGKTSVGHQLAKKMNRLFIDTDPLIEQHYHATEYALLTTHDIYQHRGSSYFRALEKKIIMALVPTKKCIIATGGGSLLDPNNVIHLKKQGKLIYLSALFTTILKRLKVKPAFLEEQPFEENLKTVYEQRIKNYKNAADMEILTDNKSIADISEEILQLLTLREDLFTIC